MEKTWLDALFDGLYQDIADKKRAQFLVKKAVSSLSDSELEELYALQPSISVEVTRNSDAVVKGDKGWVPVTRNPPCHHKWTALRRFENLSKNLVKIVHKCFLCGYIKSTTRVLNTKVINKKPKIRSTECDEQSKC